MAEITNLVILRGRLSSEPKFYESGKGCSFNLAVSKVIGKDADGNWQKQTSFISCKMLGQKQADKAKVLKKGSAITFVGEWITGSYDGKNGKVYTNDCIGSFSIDDVDSLVKASASVDDFAQMDSDIDEIPFE